MIDAPTPHSRSAPDHMNVSPHRTLPVSVIVPTYNRPDRLERALRSVLAQTRPPMEVIVVDDASSENIEAVVERFGDPRLRYHRLAQRQGAGAARNRGAELASSEWLAFQDSDDEWLINKLELQWQAVNAEADPPALICGSYIIVPRQGRPRLVAPTNAMGRRDWPLEARFGFPFIAPTWLLRRSVFLDAGGFDADLPNLEDWELSFRLHDRGGFVALQDALVIKHGSADGLNKDAARQVTSLQRIHARHGEMIEQKPQLAARFWLRLAYHSARLGDLDTAREALRQVNKRASSLRNRALYLASLADIRLLRRALRAWLRADELA